MNKSFEERVAQAVAERKAKNQEATLALLDNPKFLETQAKIATIKQEVAILDTIVHQLNSSITPFIARDGSKFSVRVFPVSQFGIGLDKLIGIITNSTSAFTDEMALQYEAIIGVPYTELVIANNLLGTVDYVNKDGVYVEGSRTTTKEDLEVSSDEPLAHLKAVKEWETDNAEQLFDVLQSIGIRMGIYEILPKSPIQLLELIHKWEQSAERRAKKQLAELTKAEALNIDTSFTIDD